MKKLWLLIFPFLILIVFLVSLLFDLPILHWMELKSIDWRFGWRGPIETTGDVVVVAIDEKSLHQEGRWPWPRARMADLLREIEKAGARFIALDIVFAEASQGDEVLARALKEKDNIILGYFFYQTERELEEAVIPREKMEGNFRAILPSALPAVTGLRETLPEMFGVVSNTPFLSSHALSQGYFNAIPDSDGVIRRFPLMLTYLGEIFPSMGLETLSHREKGFDPVPVRGEEGTLQGLSLGARFIPTNRWGEMAINYRGGQELFPVYSAADFFEGKIKSGELEGKTVLVGATAIGIYDLRVTPLSPVFPGILIQANLLDNLYRGDFLVRNLVTQWGAAGWLMVMTLFLTVLLPRIRIVFGMLVTSGVILGYGVIVQWFFGRGFLLPLVSPSLGLLTLYIAITIYRGLTEERQKRMLRKAFQSYLHPDLVREMTENLNNLKLGGEHADCTILFSDIRNFTSMSEKMNPETLVQMMNSYFEPIVKVILEEGGYIDKFIGDAVMAIFGAPKKTSDHALRACRAASAMQKTVAELGPVFRERYGIPTLHIGIGLNTGDAVVGNIGTKERLNYTVMGDTVNLASRLETATKSLGSATLMSEATYDRVKGEIEARFVDEISVKGKAEKIRVYELVRASLSS